MSQQYDLLAEGIKKQFCISIFEEKKEGACEVDSSLDKTVPPLFISQRRRGTAHT